MADEHQLREARRRGEQAQNLLQNQLLVEAFAAVQEKYHTDIERLPPEQAPDIARQLRALADVKSQLATYVNRGKVAQEELNGRQRR